MKDVTELPSFPPGHYLLVTGSITIIFNYVAMGIYTYIRVTTSLKFEYCAVEKEDVLFWDGGGGTYYSLGRSGGMLPNESVDFFLCQRSISGQYPWIYYSSTCILF